MSADNTIVVLGTVSEYKQEGSWRHRVPKYKVYRVAEVQAWDNFEWYKENQPYNLGYYLWSEFKDCIVYDSLEHAVGIAELLQEQTDFVEYGIQVVNTEYVFPGD